MDTPAASAAPLAELPYVFSCPTDASGLLDLLNLAGPLLTRRREMLRRLLAGHHTRLKEANRAKLETLANLLIDHMMQMADEASAVDMSIAAHDHASPSALLEVVVPSLHTIAEQLPLQIALIVLERLERVKRAWRAARRDARDGAGGRRRAYVSLPPASLALMAACVQLFALTGWARNLNHSSAMRSCASAYRCAAVRSSAC